MYYGDERESMVNISIKLQALGWKIYGFSEDQSDSMTDYYCPASWGGIATKNGYTLCIDIKEYRVKSESGKEVFSYNYTGKLYNNDIAEKISKLEALTVERGATEAEAENAKQMIEKIKESAEQQYKTESDKREKSKVLLYTYPVFIANPKGCNWHIEKDGKIYGKGKGAFQFSNLPHLYNITENKFAKFRNEPYQPTKEQQSEVNKFLVFVHKLDNIANGVVNMGDGTEETEIEGLEAEAKRGYELKEVTETKTGLKMVEVTGRTEIKEGDYLTFSHHGGFWLVTHDYMRKGTWKGITEERKAFDYECVGSEKRGFQRVKNTQRYYQWESQILKGIEEGKTKIYELKEVTETVTVEKWVKIDTKKTETKAKEKNSKPEQKQEQQTAETGTKFEYQYTITEDVDTRDNSPLWVMKIADKLSREDYIKVSEQLKKIGGYYSKFKHGFIFKENPSNKLEGLEIETMNQRNDDPYKTQEIKEGCLYDCHFKSWNMSIEEIQTECNNLNIAYQNMSDKIGFTNLTAEQTISMQNISNKNGSIFFIDKEISLQEQQTKYQAEKEKLLDKIDNNINSLQSKIDGLSGDYKTNTWKRMNEQASRESKKESFEIDIKILEYVKDKLIDNEPLTKLEKGLIVGAFRDTIHGYYVGKYGTCSRELKFPQVDYNLPLDGWYNKEVPQRQNKLKKYGINNTEQLNSAVDEYKIIYDIKIDRSINQKEKRIKQLEREFKMQQKGDVNFTPSEVAEQMVNYARINENSIVLEPSAGIAKIADKIKTRTEKVDVCEVNYSFRELLELKGFNIVGDDFLQYNKFNYYDAIIMNPPFSNNQDIEHLQHAYKLLKNNGTLVCITSPHWQFANDRKSQDFREWLEDKEHFIKDLASGTFEMTGVSSRIIVIEKNEEVLEEAI